MPRRNQKNRQKNRNRPKNRPTKCICPNCGYKEQHIQGKPCNEKRCPECQTNLKRKS
ncbi:hypothetical protein [Methanonatronarchaeum sp. AMET-Sl]|uniref:hypothetical protein n=1 Tax=Methanonatronarchaeum sp. AMET-Sl TaxID=3037654 RepID=UPI00244D9EF3|nr:hypothetical protein [Methanonatronarchaeum sp. AMET-Sl]WGI17483.1 hypothetical protein QEN48_00310 [Methanonatronarchaeum sp. AMET-Sl]